MEKEFSSKEIKEKIREIRKEQINLRPAVIRNNQLDNEIEKLQKICKHENAYEYSRSKDDYEGRVYANIMCDNCGHMWEERVRLGKCPYPKLKTKRNQNL